MLKIKLKIMDGTKTIKGPRIIIAFFLAVFILAITVIFIYQLAFTNRIYPNIYASNINLSGLTSDEAIHKLSAYTSSPTNLELVGTEVYTINLEEIGYSHNLEGTADNAMNVYKSGSFIENFVASIKAPFNRTDITVLVRVDENKLSEIVSVISEAETKEPVYPKVSLINGGISIETGKAGIVVNPKKLSTSIKSHLAELKNSQMLIPKTTSNPEITPKQVGTLKTRAETLVDKSITLTFEFSTYTLTASDLVNFLAANGYYEEHIKDYVSEISELTDRPAQNPIFEFEGGRVREFAPSKDGVVVNQEVLAELILAEVKHFEAGKEDLITSISVPVTTDSPDYKTSEVNELGIRELLGRGDSTYRGSIASRIHNISVASSHFNGVLVPPDAVFSFNNTVGDISVFTGYQQAYIIKDGQTVLGDGGGVCQVSTTLFRAALASGLPIVERRSHSYRVGYYEQDAKPGLDATVYSPTTDLKFKNNTPAHLLIQTLANPANATLVFEIYGTSDGRIASTTIPIVYDVSPPPEDLYTDDPTLPIGVIKQIDYKAWGAKSKFDYTVTRNGEVIYEKTFHSNYRPWQAKFLRGTGPAT